MYKRQDVTALIERHAFREDLYYRLSTVKIRIPPLAARREDIPILARSFLEKETRALAIPCPELSPEFLRCLCAYDWPGNVRELQHAIERAVILSDSSLLKPANFMLQPQPEKKVDTDEILNLEQLERHAIERAMKRSEGNLSRAAEYLGITRYALYRKLEKLGL